MVMQGSDVAHGFVSGLAHGALRNIDYIIGQIWRSNSLTLATAIYYLMLCGVTLLCVLLTAPGQQP
jgi:hypothetical protein